MNKIEHLFMKAAEEAGEVAQEAGKCALFGPFDRYPEPNTSANIERFLTEVNDLVAVAEMIADELQLEKPVIGRLQVAAKRAKVAKWMRYAKRKGTLTE